VYVDSTAYVNAVPTPLPAVAAGAAPAAVVPGLVTVSPFGFSPIPVHAVASVPVLPRLGQHGLLVDLDYAQALAGQDTTGATSEVWLAADAPTGVVAALRHQGLTITGTQTVASRSSTYAAEPGVVGIRFQVVAGLLALAIAAVALLLTASVERRDRARELVALRRQGLPLRSARAVSAYTYAVLAGGAAVAGLLGAVAVRLLAARQPLFADGWHVLDRPPEIGTGALLITIGVTVVALGAAAVTAAYQLGRAVGTTGSEAR
jgi:hypothetical protein